MGYAKKVNLLKASNQLKKVSNELKKQAIKYTPKHELDPQYEVLEEVKIEIPVNSYGIEYEGGDNVFGIIKNKVFYWQGTEDEKPSKKEIEDFKEKIFLKIPEAVNSLIKHVFRPTIKKIEDLDDFFLSKEQVVKEMKIDYINITFGEESIKNNILYVKDFLNEDFVSFDKTKIVEWAKKNIEKHLYSYIDNVDNYTLVRSNDE